MLTRLGTVRTERRDAGMTLAEVLVGMGLLTTVGTLALTFFVGSTEQADRVGAQTLNAADVRVAAEQIAAELRLADTPQNKPGFPTGRFETLGTTRIVFYANLDRTSRVGTAARTPPTRVEISVDAANAQLRQRLYRPRSTTYPASYADNYPTTPSTSSILLSGLANPATTTVFTYCTAATDPSVTCTPATDARSVSSVGIVLTVAGTSRVRAQTIRTTVAITGAVL